MFAGWKDRLGLLKMAHLGFDVSVHTLCVLSDTPIIKLITNIRLAVPNFR